MIPCWLREAWTLMMTTTPQPTNRTSIAPMERLCRLQRLADVVPAARADSADLVAAAIVVPADGGVVAVVVADVVPAGVVPADLVAHPRVAAAVIAKLLA